MVFSTAGNEESAPTRMPGGEEGTSMSMDMSHLPNSSRAGLKPAALTQVTQLQQPTTL